MLVGVTNKFNPDDLIEISVKGLLNQIYSRQGRFTVGDMMVKSGLLYKMMSEFDNGTRDFGKYYLCDISRVEFDCRVNDLRIWFNMVYDADPDMIDLKGGFTYMDIPISEPELISLIRESKLNEVIGDNNE